MYNIIYEELRIKLTRRFEEQLKAQLNYHNVGHTLDVVKRAETLAKLEGIEDPETLFLLKTAALFHDSGFLEVYAGHELKSCEIMRTYLQPYALAEEKLNQIEAIILATRMPQNPQTLLEEIICDADLDYLGRDDFEKISQRLKDEMLSFGILKNYAEWEGLQLNFFDKHHYFTKSARELRDAKKAETLAALRLQYQQHNKA